MQNHVNERTSDDARVLGAPTVLSEVYGTDVSLSIWTREPLRVLPRSRTTKWQCSSSIYASAWILLARPSKHCSHTFRPETRARRLQMSFVSSANYSAT